MGLIDLVLRPQAVTVAISGPWTHGVKVDVSLPDLRSAPRNVWGDWGPMYKISVPSETSIDVVVREGEADEPKQEAIQIDEIHVDSPMIASERVATPLCMKLPLARHGCRLELYFDGEGHVARANLEPLERPLRAMVATVAASAFPPERGGGASPGAQAVAQAHR